MSKIAVRLYAAQPKLAFAKGGLAQAARAVRNAGQFEDEILVHLSPDEFQQLKDQWGEPEINPATGMPQYSRLSKAFKKVGKVLKKVVKNPLFQAIAPMALNFLVPGLGVAVGSALGASGSTAAMLGKAVIGAGIGGAGGGTKGALAGLIGGGLQGGAGGALGKAVGLSGKTANVLGTSALSGLSSKIQGGDFGAGAFQGALGSLAPGADTAKTPPPGGTPGINGAIVQGDTSLGIPDMRVPPPSPLSVATPSILDSIKAAPGKIIDWTKANPGKAALGALAISQMAKGSGEQGPPESARPEGWDSPLPDYNFDRAAAPSRSADSYYSYGEAPEQVWFDRNDLGADQDPAAFQPLVQQDNFETPSSKWLKMKTGKSRGGMAEGGGGALSNIPKYVRENTGAHGRADNIDAKLSEGEYVIDSETVALLGDGSTDAGAKKLDDMRKKIRAHKGRALAKGRISPNAKGALAYLGAR